MLEAFSGITLAAQRAYADCAVGEVLNLPGNVQHELRKLDWRSPYYLPVPLACAAMSAAVQNYNEFSIKSLAAIARLFHSSEMLIAREGSPCVYIKTGETYSNVDTGRINPHELSSLRRLTGADEASIEKDGVLRLWWD